MQESIFNVKIVLFFLHISFVFTGFNNIAYKQPTCQRFNRGSSDSDDSLHESEDSDSSRKDCGDSDNAVDGVFYDTCSHTRNAKKTWWSVDLTDWFSISRVVIQSNVDCCGQYFDEAILMSAHNIPLLC